MRFAVVQSLLLPKPIAFEAGSSELPAKAAPLLEKVAATLGAHPGIDLLIEGHCDKREGEPTETSRRRAAAVKKWLASHGVRCAISVQPCGGGHPVATNLTAAGRRHNRRVEMQLRVR